MEQKFINLWFRNEDKLREKIITSDIKDYEYLDLLKMTIKYIINDSAEGEYGKILNEDNIRQIDNSYQGTLFFIIAENTCQPSESEYYVTCVDYESCLYCNTLQYIQFDSHYETYDDRVDDIMLLCLHLIERMKKLY